MGMGSIIILRATYKTPDATGEANKIGIPHYFMKHQHEIYEEFNFLNNKKY